MHILMLHNRYKMRGGEDEVVLAESAMLRNAGHDVRLLELNNDAIPTAGNVQTALAAVWSRNGYRNVDAYLSREKVDVLHVQNFFPLWSPAVYYAAAKHGTAVVQSVHNYRLICPAATLFRDGRHCDLCVGKKIPWPGVVHGCYQRSRPKTGAVAAMIATHWALGTWQKSVHQYVALTHYVRDQLIAGRFPAERIAVKPNFIVDPQTDAPRAEKSDYYIYVGRLSREKGLPVLFRAWKAHKHGSHLKLVGGGTPPADLPVPGGVEILGERPIAETYHLIAGAKALIVPAEWAEPFGRVVIEAFALGTPVISSSAGALGEIVEHDVTGVVAPAGDADALAVAIDRIEVDAALRARLSGNARRAYLAKFTEEVNYERLVAIYERAIAIRELATPAR